MVTLVSGLGPFEQVPTKTRITFMVRVRFSAVNRVLKEGLVCHVLAEALDRRSPIHESGAPRAERLDPPPSSSDPRKLDDEVRAWVPRDIQRGTANTSDPVA